MTHRTRVLLCAALAVTVLGPPATVAMAPGVAAAADLACVVHLVSQRDTGMGYHEQYFVVRNSCAGAAWYGYVTHQKSGMRLRRLLQLSPGETANTDGGVSIEWLGSCSYADKACYPALNALANKP